MLIGFQVVLGDRVEDRMSDKFQMAKNKLKMPEKLEEVEDITAKIFQVWFLFYFKDAGSKYSKTQLRTSGHWKVGFKSFPTI